MWHVIRNGQLARKLLPGFATALREPSPPIGSHSAVIDFGRIATRLVRLVDLGDSRTSIPDGAGTVCWWPASGCSAT